VFIVTVDLKEASQLYEQLRSSELMVDHVKRVMSNFEPETLARFFGAWDCWMAHCTAAEIDNQGVTLDFTADFMLDVLSSAKQDRRKTAGGNRIKSIDSMIRGMKFVADHAGARNLVSILESSLIYPEARSFRSGVGYNSGITRILPRFTQRREVFAPALATIQAFERRILKAGTPAHEKIFLGNLVSMFWSSMRWADVQRTQPSTLIIDSRAMRGSAWQTKTSKRGQPFGASTYGFSSRPPDWGWAHWYYKELKVWVEGIYDKASQAGGSLPSIDFLQPDFVSSSEGHMENVVLFSRLMPFGKAQTLFRRAIQAPWMEEARLLVDKAIQHTLHGIKSGVLSAAKQLSSISSEDRADQGHHKSTGTGPSSVRLYSRDDVHGALRCQDALIQSCSTGWLPMTVRLRGAGNILRQPPVQVEPVPSSWYSQEILPEFDSSPILLQLQCCSG